MMSDLVEEGKDIPLSSSSIFDSQAEYEDAERRISELAEKMEQRMEEMSK